MKRKPDAELALIEKELDDKLMLNLEEEMGDLSTQRRIILKYHLMGLGPTDIGKILNQSKQMIYHEMKMIRKYHESRVASTSQNVVVGEAITHNQNLQKEVWDLFYAADTDVVVDEDGNEKLTPRGQKQKMKAIELLATLQEKYMKMLMDVGLVKKEATKTEIIVVPPFLDDWRKAGKADEVVATIIDTSLEELDDPEPDVLPGEEDE